MVKNKKIALFIMLCSLFAGSLNAQDDVRQQIKAIKMDQSYLKSEANDSLESVAKDAAMLDLIYQYNADRLGKNLDTISVELIRPALQSLVYARGSIKRVLVFVELALVDSLSGTKVKPETINLSDIYGEHLQTLASTEYVTDAIRLLDQYKKEGKVADSGQLHSLSEIPSDANILIFDRKHLVKAVLSPADSKYYNVMQNVPDAITNYSGCGALWFK